MRQFLCFWTLSFEPYHYPLRALYKDECLYVVPGSHKTPRTPEQRIHSTTLEPPVDPFDMPGAIRVTLNRTLVHSN